MSERPDDRRAGFAPFDQDVEKRGAYEYTDGSRFSAVLANQRYTQMILSAVPFTDLDVVDVGAGDGTYTAELARLSRARAILGVEPSAPAVDRARSAFEKTITNLRFSCEFTEDLIRSGRRFDVAVYRGVLHHVVDPREEIKRAVQLASRVVILEPNGLNPMMKLVEKVSPYHRRHKERSYSPGQVAQWIEEGGGTEIRFRFFGLVPYFCPDWLARAGHVVEPIVEAIPALRGVVCGQYLMTFRGSSHAGEKSGDSGC